VFICTFHIVNPRNPDIPIEDHRRISPPEVDDRRRKEVHQHTFPLDHHNSHPSESILKVPRDPGMNVVDYVVYRPSRASMSSDWTKDESFDRELSYTPSPPEGKPQTQESSVSEMKRLWAQGGWRNHPAGRYVGEQARRMVMAEFHDAVQRKAAHQFLDKIADHGLEVKINEEILSHGFDYNAWLCLEQVRETQYIFS
jgi:hypothetical protein